MNYRNSSSDPLSVPSLMVYRVTTSAVEYQVKRYDGITDALITGYEVTRFGVPMVGEYVNAHTGRRVTISPTVYQVVSTGLQHGHLVMVGGVPHLQWCSMLLLERKVSTYSNFDVYVFAFVCVCFLHKNTECGELLMKVYLD